MIHIGIDATGLTENRTGIGNYIYPILKCLCANHPEVKFSLYSNDQIFFDPFQNVSHRVLTPKRRGPWWQGTHLRKMLIEDQPQIYWGTNGFLPFPKIKKLCTVLTVHDLVYFFSGKTLPMPSYWGRRIFQPWSVKTADRLIAVSESTAGDLKKHYHRSPDSIIKPQASSIFRHVSENERKRVREKLELPDRYFLSLGTLEPRKNLEALVNAYLQQKALHHGLPPLLMVGASGWKNSALLEAVKRGEEVGFIRRLGYVETADLPAIYALCEAYLMPSLYEGFGMPLLEAQLCGAPVAHGPHPSMHEAAGHLGVGCGVDENSLRDMFAALDTGSLPLVCRLPADFSGSPGRAAREMWAEFQAATRPH